MDIIVKQPTTITLSGHKVVVTVKNKVHSFLLYRNRTPLDQNNRLNLQFMLLKCALFYTVVWCYDDEVERLSACMLLRASCCCLLMGLGGFLSPAVDKHEVKFREQTSCNAFREF